MAKIGTPWTHVASMERKFSPGKVCVGWSSPGGSTRKLLAVARTTVPRPTLFINLMGAGNLLVCKQCPFSTSHSFTFPSAPADSRYDSVHARWTIASPCPLMMVFLLILAWSFPSSIFQSTMVLSALPVASSVDFLSGFASMQFTFLVCPRMDFPLCFASTVLTCPSRQPTAIPTCPSLRHHVSKHTTASACLFSSSTCNSRFPSTAFVTRHASLWFTMAWSSAHSSTRAGWCLFRPTFARVLFPPTCTIGSPNFHFFVHSNLWRNVSLVFLPSITLGFGYPRRR
mmetsp:Transcript_7628/g.47082  ORF Transcript_7628/g.47082 Transcript_7628/m.47082 type:complete len:285 (+) Transcript_7628:2383-3237(+)